MHIKQYKKLKFSDSFMNYYPIIPFFEKNAIYYIYFFFDEFYEYIKKNGVLKFLEEINKNKEDEYVYETISLSIDWNNKLLYLHETQFDYCKNAKNSELKKILDELTPLQACQQNLIKHAVLTQENFNKIIIDWNNNWESSKENPFLLLYQNDKDCFDLMSFKSQELMKKFIVESIIAYSISASI